MWREALTWHHGQTYCRYLQELARRGIDLRAWTEGVVRGRSREHLYAAARRLGRRPAAASIVWVPGRPIVIIIVRALHDTGEALLETVLTESIRLVPLAEPSGRADAVIQQHETLSEWMVETGAVALGERIGVPTPRLRWRLYLSTNTIEWQRENGWLRDAEIASAWAEGRRRAAAWASEPCRSADGSLEPEPPRKEEETAMR